MPDLSELALEADPPPDSDDSTLFTKQFYQHSSVALGLDTCCVLHMVMCGDKLCATSDTGSLSIYNLETLTKSHSFQPHCKAVTGVASHTRQPQQLVSCSLDQTVKLWDTRQDCTEPVTILRDTSKPGTGPPVEPGKPLNCVAVNSAGLIVSGTEQIAGESYILFWDSRVGNRLLGGYWDTHSDDITTLQFHPDKQDLLASGSTDGLANVLDLAQSDEESALMNSLNTNDSVAGLTWFSQNKVAIRTHTEGLLIWNSDISSPQVTLSRSDVCKGIGRRVSDYTYIAGIHPSINANDTLSIIAGSSYVGNTCIRLSKVEDNLIVPEATFGSEGVGIARCSLALNQCCVTGGEDGVVKVWKEGPESTQDHGGKVISKSDVRGKPY